MQLEKILTFVDPLDETKGYLLPTATSATNDTSITYTISQGSVTVQFLIIGSDTELQDSQTVF